MQTKTKKIVNIIATAIPAMMVLLSGFMKLAGAKSVVDKLSAMGVGPYIPLFGVMEIVFAILFIIPKTMRLGFVLLSCYFAGAIATDLSHGGSIANALIPVSLVWIGMFVRDKSAFVPFTKQMQVA
jgi:uncharacterized membrane protein YphA (DoxX/SURF4 family)